jgi:hypothetical protein
MIIGLAGGAPDLQKLFLSAIVNSAWKLHGLLVLLRRSASLESAEIPSFAVFGFFFREYKR